MTNAASGALIGWSRRRTPEGAFIRLQLAASPEALAARDFMVVTMSLNEACLQSFARDLRRAAPKPGQGFWPRLRWWLPRTESLLTIANALLGVVIAAAGEMLSLLVGGCRRLILWRGWIEKQAKMHARRTPAARLPPERRRRRSADRAADRAPSEEAVRLS